MQCIERSGRELVSLLMRHERVATILATGGPAMVKAAYSSGTPAIGVGAGNAPVVITADVDATQVAHKIVESKGFDNGLICGAENDLLVLAPLRQPLEGALEGCGAAVLGPAETARLTRALIDPETQEIRKGLIGKTAALIAGKAEIARTYPIRLLVVPVDERTHPAFCREKLCPVLSLRSVADLEEAIAISNQLLGVMGKGHTAVIHTRDAAAVREFGTRVQASRVLVNDHAVFGCMGHSNHLAFSMTLGCGAAGGSSSSDNITYTHLINIRRVALPRTEIALAADLALLPALS